MLVPTLAAAAAGAAAVTERPFQRRAQELQRPADAVFAEPADTARNWAGSRTGIDGAAGAAGLPAADSNAAVAAAAEAD